MEPKLIGSICNKLKEHIDSTFLTTFYIHQIEHYSRQFIIKKTGYIRKNVAIHHQIVELCAKFKKHPTRTSIIDDIKALAKKYTVIDVKPSAPYRVIVNIKNKGFRNHCQSVLAKYWDIYTINDFDPTSANMVIVDQHNVMLDNLSKAPPNTMVVSCDIINWAYTHKRPTTLARTLKRFRIGDGSWESAQQYATMAQLITDCCFMCMPGTEFDVYINLNLIGAMWADTECMAMDDHCCIFIADCYSDMCKTAANIKQNRYVFAKPSFVYYVATSIALGQNPRLRDIPEDHLWVPTNEYDWEFCQNIKK